MYYGMYQVCIVNCILSVLCMYSVRIIHTNTERTYWYVLWYVLVCIAACTIFVLGMYMHVFFNDTCQMCIPILSTIHANTFLNTYQYKQDTHRYKQQTFNTCQYMPIGMVESGPPPRPTRPPFWRSWSSWLLLPGHAIQIHGIGIFIFIFVVHV